MFERLNLTFARTLSVLLVASPGACGDVLEVETPSRIPAEILEVPLNAAVLVNGAIADFDCAFGAYVVVGGLVGEELIDATQTADRFPYDRRDMQPSDRRYSAFACTALGVYTPLQTARASADNVIRLLEGWSDAEVPNRTRLIATAAAYSGYARLLLGEGFCSSVVSTLNPDRSIIYGGAITRDSMFALAEARFTQAIAAAQTAANSDIERMALVGRARARVNRGLFAQAALDAAQVPEGYIRNMTASTVSARRQNRVFDQNSSTNTATSVGEPYRSYSQADDPRVPLVDTTRVSVTLVQHWYQTKYTTAASPIPIASWLEAKLIVAEAELEAGNTTAARDSLNFFRARGIQSALVTTDPATLRAELIDQRRRELFLTGHHLGDVIRFNLTLSPPEGSEYHGSGNYGSHVGAEVCLPLPDIERNNNPNIP